MSIKIYRDNAANAIFIEDSNGVQFLNSLQASVPSIDNVTITDLSKQIDLVANTNHSDFVDENDNPYGSTDIEVCNALNIVFTGTGTTTTNLPVITSPLVINSVEGSIINYELTADYGVGYEWDFSNTTGLTDLIGNPRKIIGGFGLAAGTYNVPVKAINYNGEDAQTIVINVANPPFANTKSINFLQNDYLDASSAEVNNVFGRSSNGSGESWSISAYFKAGTHNNSVQTIMFAGGNSSSSDPMVLLYWEGNHAGRQNVSIRYGSNYNYIEKSTPIGSVSNDGTWHHIMITFDGGTTGNQSGQLSQYYSRFKIFLDGVNQTTINSHAAFGNASAFNIQVFRVGRWGTGTSYLRDNCKIDELSIFDSDVSSNISNIYNSGLPFDLSTLGTPPVNWWRMGDDDTYPLLLDSSGTTDLTMYSMNPSSIVNDVPI
tara:strand:+ start:19 stop:1314 length:1296 start_codon:yes stop_codon:yes gene_type:complete